VRGQGDGDRAGEACAPVLGVAAGVVERPPRIKTGARAYSR
jgi:hypothetical protein